MKNELSSGAAAGIVAVVVVVVAAMGYMLFLRPSADLAAAPPGRVLPGQPGYPTPVADTGNAPISHQPKPGESGYTPAQ